MQVKQRFAIQSLIVTIIVNAILLATIYFLLGDVIQASNQAFLMFLVGGVITLLLWLINYVLGSRLIDAEPARTTGAASAPPAVPATPVPSPTATAQPQTVTSSAETGAVQLLAILQRQGRLIDFLRENLQMYEDAQIGAAVRTIHEGCRQALDEHVKVEPIFNETEGSTVSVPPGFDPHAIRLTGDVVGEPPFRGELRHRGWRVVSINLPKQADGRDKQQIVAAAEVELRA